METYVIYSHFFDFDALVSLVRNAFPKAEIQTGSPDEDGFRTLSAELGKGLSGGSKKLELHYRQRHKPSYHLQNTDCPTSLQLAGMYRFVDSLPAQDEERKARLLRKIETINSECVLRAEDWDRDSRDLLMRISGENQAFIFANPGQSESASGVQHFMDSSLKLILDLEGRSADGDVMLEVLSSLFDENTTPTPAQEARKARSIAFLQQQRIPVMEKLPCIPDEHDIQLRTPQDVTERLYALMLMALKGEGLEQDILEKQRACFGIGKLSPVEESLYPKTILSDEERALITWRYEAADVLFWVLGLKEKPVYPSRICDVEGLASLLLSMSREELEARAQLRSKSEVLDELDLIYRMHWACVNARIKGQETPGDLDAGIVYERHYVLNWLTGYMGQNWDDVQTHT